MADNSKHDNTPMTLTKLSLTADYYSSICPAVTRGQMLELLTTRRKLKYVSPTGQSSHCPFCGQIFRPMNHVVKIIPRMRLNKKIQKLRRKKVQPLKKHGFKNHILNNYEEGYNFLQIKCLSCGKLSKTKLYSRQERTLHTNQAHNVRKEKDEVTKLTKSQKKKQKAKRKQRERSSGTEETQRENSPSHARFEPVVKSSSQGVNQRLDDKPTEKTPHKHHKLSLKSSNSPRSTTTKQNIASGSHQETATLLATNKQGKKNKRQNAKKAFSTLQTLLSAADGRKEAVKGQSSLAQFLGSL